MKIFLSLLATVLSLSFSTNAQAAFWDDKPVFCAEEKVIFSILSRKNEQLIFIGDLYAKVRDPDESDGLSDSAARLPFALYANLVNNTFTVLEYHEDPYNIYCVIADGDNLDAIIIEDEEV